jgi:hypothetical protein
LKQLTALGSVFVGRPELVDGGEALRCINPFL